MISQIDLFEDLMLESRLARSQWKALSFSEERLDRPVERLNRRSDTDI